MKIVEASAILENPFKEFITDEQYMVQQLKHIERIARTCYKSEGNVTDESYIPMIRSLIRRGHEAMLEHGSFSVRFIVDRGVSHEIVRHRVASFAQESTRYCNYNKDKFGNEITVIKPFFWKEDSEQYKIWKDACETCEAGYNKLLVKQLVDEVAFELATPQEARSVLPNSLKTEIVMTANFREWRHFFKLRAEGETGKPHPQMLEVAVPLLNYVKSICPGGFEDIIAEDINE